MTTLLYLMACLMSPAPLINLAESRVIRFQNAVLVASSERSTNLFLVANFASVSTKLVFLKQDLAYRTHLSCEYLASDAA